MLFLCLQTDEYSIVCIWNNTTADNQPTQLWLLFSFYEWVSFSRYSKFFCESWRTSTDAQCFHFISYLQLLVAATKRRMFIWLRSVSVWDICIVWVEPLDGARWHVNEIIEGFASLFGKQFDVHCELLYNYWNPVACCLRILVSAEFNRKTSRTLFTSLELG